MAARVWLYAVPTVPLVSEDVVMDSGPEVAATVMDRALVAETGVAEESVTLTVKLKVPVAVGVPEITPVELRVSPVGRVPAERVQV